MHGQGLAAVSVIERSESGAALTAAVKNEIRQLTAEVADLQNVSASSTENNRQTGKHATTVSPPHCLDTLSTATMEFNPSCLVCFFTMCASFL